MFDKQVFKETYATLHASKDTIKEVMKMTRQKKRRRISRAALAAAVLACILAAAAAASTILIPVLRDYFGAGAGYEQSGALLGLSQNSGGWAMTLTDCVGDDRSLYIGMELAAPEGVALTQDSYRLKDWSVSIPGLNTGGSSHYTVLPDSDPNDNRLHLALWYDTLPEGGSLNGRRVKLHFGNLCHRTTYNEASGVWDYETDSPSSWDFDTVISYPDNMIRLKPNLPVTTLDVEAVISYVEISPISVYIVIEGESLKGHHSWVPKNAPDGYYGCIEYQEMTAYTRDGTAVPLTGSLVGSGCSGGEADTDEPGYLHLSRKFDTLMDLDSLSSIEICGVSIPLN